MEEKGITENGRERNLLQPKLNFPSIIFGTSGLGNLFVALEEKVKYEIVQACIQHSSGPVVFDTAGKYGAGLALESLGRSLRALNVKPDEVIISNKLGWVRTELKTEEPTFEPGVWKGLKYDAVQKISYNGIIECFEQGNELLGGYVPQLVSVHDPDEYLAQAQNEADGARLYNDILEAYKALEELKAQGKVREIGVGAKDWRAIERIARDVQLDWVMIANSMTIMSHPQELMEFMRSLAEKGVRIFNSAVFHSGFVIGGNYYDYKLIGPDTEENKALFEWRDRFSALCDEFGVKPSEAGVQFALNIPGVTSIALSTTNPNRVKENIDMANAAIPAAFWETLKAQKLIKFLPIKDTNDYQL